MDIKSASHRCNLAQQRFASVLLALAGREAEGLALSQIARGVKAASERVFHDLGNLAEAGLAEKMPNGNWRLGPRIVQIARDHQLGLARLQEQVRELEQRYTRSAS